VQRTGHRGMIPANYVELVQWTADFYADFKSFPSFIPTIGWVHLSIRKRI